MASSLSLVPRESSRIEDSLKALGMNFSLDPVVVEALIKTGISNFEEFRFFFDSEGAVEPWLSKLSLGDGKMLQVSRLRRAWHAITLYFRQMEQDRSKVASDDLDSMLGETELRDTKVSFWRRYRQRFPPEVHPSDSTLSRVSREMSKRMLCVFSIWKVKSLQFQLMTTQKKRKLGDNLFTEEVEEEEPSARDTEAYLDKLQTLMVAYAMAGVGPLPAPGPGFDPKEELTLGADSTRFAQVPLDIAMQYFYRAKRATAALPPGKRLAWLQTRDAEERAEWTARFRESSQSLGVIIKEVYQARDAHWLPPTPAEPASTAPGKSAPPAAAPAASKFALGKSIQGKQVARVLRDGTLLCQAFQEGSCKSKGGKCKLGQHRCGHVTKKERVCGAPNHGAAACRNTPKA